eukprot:scaffold13315_cov63-Phaeocystis_antarctica.AAC.2
MTVAAARAAAERTATERAAVKRAAAERATAERVGVVAVIAALECRVAAEERAPPSPRSPPSKGGRHCGPEPRGGSSKTGTDWATARGPRCRAGVCRALLGGAKGAQHFVGPKQADPPRARRPQFLSTLPLIFSQTDFGPNVPRRRLHGVRLRTLLCISRRSVFACSTCMRFVIAASAATPGLSACSYYSRGVPYHLAPRNMLSGMSAATKNRLSKRFSWRFRHPLGRPPAATCRPAERFLYHDESSDTADFPT